MSNLKASVGFKGATGMSAYELAVKNGYVGDEQTWLASLGTSSHFSEDSQLYTATSGQTVFDLPTAYTSNSFIDVYKDGLRLNSTEYTINNVTRKLTLTSGATVGQKVNIICLTMSTNSLPIVSTLSSSSTNNQAVGAALAYGMQSNISTLQGNVSTLNTTVVAKFDKANIAVVTGDKANIAAGATETVDISYPTGFTQANTVIISKMVSSNNNYYDTANEENTTSGFPVIKMIALNASNIRIWLKNNSNSQTRTGYYKITLMKVS